MSIKPNIVHIVGDLRMGGSEQLVFNLITHPILRHYRHTIICILSTHGQFYEKFKKIGIPIYFCPLRWITPSSTPFYRINRLLDKCGILIFYYRFPYLLKRIRADLVHSHHHRHINIQIKTIINKTKLPFIWTIHALYRSLGSVKENVLSNALNLIEQNDRVVITAVSRAALNDVLGNRKLPKDKIRLIYNGVDLSKFKARSDQGRILRKQWSIPEDALVFGAAGRLSQEKRFDLLLEAAEKIVKRHSKVYVVIAGEGGMRQTLEEQIDRLGLRGRIHLVGYQSNMVQFWREVDVAVISSDSEGLPMVLLEACASGVPCIATRVGGIPEVLGNGSGILVEPGSKEALAKAMEEMLDPEVRSKYGKRARKVASRFSIDKTAEQYDDLYKELLGIS